MQQEVDISSVQNPKIKGVLDLFDRRDRDKSGLFIVEGYRELKRAADKGISIESLFICPDLFLGENEPALISQIQKAGASVYVCSDKVLRKISYRDRPDGLVAIAQQMKHSLADICEISKNKKKPPFYLIAEAIEKPGNLGTILRSSDASGVDGVVVCDRCTDIYNPNVVRASVGTLFSLPVVEASSSETISYLKSNQIQIVSSSPQAKFAFTEVDLTGPLAIVVGTEQLGLSKTWMEASDIIVKIPMLGMADSLNVATATTLLLYEVLRQRGGGSLGSALLR